MLTDPPLPLAAKAGIDAVACQVIEIRMPGMIGRVLIAAWNACDLIIQTLLIAVAHEPEIARVRVSPGDRSGNRTVSRDDPAKQRCTLLSPLIAGQPERCLIRCHGMLPTQTIAADIRRRVRT
jgi:hypothetical protein